MIARLPGVNSAPPTPWKARAAISVGPDGATPQNVEPHFPSGSSEARGQALFGQICVACHGSATKNQITNQAVHDQLECRGTHADHDAPRGERAEHERRTRDETVDDDMHRQGAEVSLYLPRNRTP